MRRLDDTPLDPEIEASLDAIDATLAGEPVDPRFAELAELALLLADERPAPSEKFARELDARVQWRFDMTASTRGVAPRRQPKSLWSWIGQGATATAVAGVLAGLVFLIANTGGGASSSNSYSSSSSSTSAPVTATASSSSGTTSSSSGAAGASSGAIYGAPSGKSLGKTPSVQTKSRSTNESLRSGASANFDANQFSLAPGAPTPSSNGRVIVQSAELDLAAAPNKIDSVAQQVFNVVGAAGGIVDHSSITQTGGTDGYANFQLRIPSPALAHTLGRLSQLSGATVVARTDNTQDVNNQWVSAHRKLADDKALRAALLKQLAAATTTGEIDSLNARIHDAEGAIASDEGAINSLSAQINYSRVTVTINAKPIPLPLQHHHTSSGGFTLGHSAHIAGRVLVVAAGVALIALAGLVPVGLVVALGAWIAVTFRRRRREQALDVA